MMKSVSQKSNRVVRRRETKETNHWTNMWANRIHRLALYGCRGLYLIGLILLLQGCALLVTATGAGTVGTGAAVTTSTAMEVAQALDVAKTAGDVVAYNQTGKTLTDHVVSKLTGKDCRLFRKIKGEGDYCEPVEIVLPVLNTKNKIKIFQIIEDIRPVNGHMGPLTRQAYWRYEHGGRIWDSDLYDLFPKNDTEIREFQKEHGIEPIGKVGPKTIRALIEYYKEIKKEIKDGND